MDNDELIVTAESLASRYGATQEFEDLRQEGLLAALKAKGDDPTITDTSLVGVMRKAMHTYMNIKLKPVTIPHSGKVYSLLSAIKGDDEVQPKNYTEQALIAALSGCNEPLEPQTIRQEFTTEEKYEDQETIDHIINNLWVFLTDKQALAIDSCFFGGYTPTELAKHQGVSQQRVSQWLSSGLDKLKKMLMELEK